MPSRHADLATAAFCLYHSTRPAAALQEIARCSGDLAEQFWLITDGQVFLDAEVPGYDNVALETLKPGAVLGWSWLFPPYRWHFGAVAITATDTVTFNGPLVRALCQRDPALGYELTTRFLWVMGERLQFARRRLQDCQRAAGRHLGRPSL